MKSFENMPQEALIDELKKYKTLFDKSPEAIFFTTHDGRILDVISPQSRFTGIPERKCCNFQSGTL